MSNPEKNTISALAIAEMIQIDRESAKKTDLAKPVEERRRFNPIQIPLWDDD